MLRDNKQFSKCHAVKKLVYFTSFTFHFVYSCLVFSLFIYFIIFQKSKKIQSKNYFLCFTAVKANKYDVLRNINAQIVRACIIWAATWENRIFAYAKTKTQISAFVFTTRIVQPLYFLNLKFQVSSLIQWLRSLVCVGPGRKPRRPVFWRRGSIVKVNDLILKCDMPFTHT